MWTLKLEKRLKVATEDFGGEKTAVEGMAYTLLKVRPGQWIGIKWMKVDSEY